jgi:hypothetical protein
MPVDGFGSNLWKNLQAVKLGDDGGIEAPVRANGRDGIVVGSDAVANLDPVVGAETSPTHGPLRRLWSRMVRR